MGLDQKSVKLHVINEHIKIRINIQQPTKVDVNKKSISTYYKLNFNKGINTNKNQRQSVQIGRARKNNRAIKQDAIVQKK